MLLMVLMALLDPAAQLASLARLARLEALTHLLIHIPTASWPSINASNASSLILESPLWECLTTPPYCLENYYGMSSPL